MGLSLFGFESLYSIFDILCSLIVMLKRATDKPSRSPGRLAARPAIVLDCAEYRNVARWNAIVAAVS